MTSLLEKKTIFTFFFVKWRKVLRISLLITEMQFTFALVINTLVVCATRSLAFQVIEIMFLEY